MVGGEVVNISNFVNKSSAVVNDSGIGLIQDLGSLALWLQAAGLVVILWIVFQVIILILNRKRMKEIYAIKEDMKRIESKIDRLLKGRK